MLDNHSTDTLTVGEVYQGRVLKIKPFGAIVAIPGVPAAPPGLVHISQIANGFISSVAEVLAVGDEVDVRVITSDDATGKISLSMKDVPQRIQEYDPENPTDTTTSYYYDAPPITPAQAAGFEEKLKSWQKLSNDRIAGINRRNKRNKRR
jgi:predicted RNA-binding protein with RPS1 domain